MLFRRNITGFLRKSLIPYSVDQWVVGYHIVSMVLFLLWLDNVRLPVLFGMVMFTQLGVYPGFIFLSLINRKSEDVFEFAILSVGVSQVLVMVLGVLLSAIPNSLINAPFRTGPVLSTIIAINIILSIIVFMAPKREFLIPTIERRITNYRIILLSILYPILGIIGSFYMGRYNSNAILLMILLFFSVSPLLLLNLKERKYAPLVILAISLTLLISHSLIAPHLNMAADAIGEFNVAREVLNLGRWTPTSLSHRHGNLRLGVLHPLYTVSLDISLLFEFKTINPVLFSLVPVVLFKSYNRIFSYRIAILGVFYYISCYSFYAILSQNTRTSIAILYLSLILYMFAKKEWAKKNKILLLIFISGAVFSHSGTTYLVILGAVATAIISKFVVPYTNTIDLANENRNQFWVILVIVLSLSWYMFITQSRLLEFYYIVTGTIKSIITSDLLSQSSRTTKVVTTDYESLSLKTTKYLYYISGAVISLGSLFYFIDILKGKRSFSPYVGYFSVSLLAILFSASPVGDTYGIFRLFPITLVFLAPLLVFAVRESSRVLESVLTPTNVLNTQLLKQGLVLFLVIFFLFNSGVVSAMVTHDTSTNTLVDRPRIIESGDISERFYLFKRYRSSYDITSSNWLLMFANERPTFTDRRPGIVVTAFGPENSNFNTRYVSENQSEMQARTGRLPINGYFYISEFNTLTGKYTIPTQTHLTSFGAMRFVGLQEIRPNREHRVYSNGRSRIYSS